MHTCNKLPSGTESCSHIFQVSLITVCVKRAAYHRKYTVGDVFAFEYEHEMRPSLNDQVSWTFQSCCLKHQNREIINYFQSGNSYECFGNKSLFIFLFFLEILSSSYPKKRFLVCQMSVFIKFLLSFLVKAILTVRKISKHQ